MKKWVALMLWMVSTMASASSWWADLWQTRDQQGAALLSSAPEKSARLFKDPSWKAVANYRSGHYQEAAEKWSSQKSATGYYNQGNALAHLGQYPEAIQAYDQALKIEPNHQDAAYNKAIIEKLLQKKKQEKQNQSQNQDQKSQQPEDPKDSKDKQDSKNSKDQKSEPKSSEKKKPNEKTAQKKQEKQQADQQWLKQIPDEPGGLLQHKFWRDHKRYQEQGLAQ